MLTKIRCDNVQYTTLTTLYFGVVFLIKLGPWYTVYIMQQ